MSRQVFILTGLVLLIIFMVFNTERNKYKPVEKLQSRVRISVLVTANSAQSGAEKVTSLVESANAPERLLFIVMHSPRDFDVDCLVATRTKLCSSNVNEAVANSIEIRIKLTQPNLSNSSALIEGTDWLSETEPLLVFSNGEPLTQGWDDAMVYDLSKKDNNVIQAAPIASPGFACIESETCWWQPFQNPPLNPISTLAVCPSGAIILRSKDWKPSSWALTDPDKSSLGLTAEQPSTFWATLFHDMGLEVLSSGQVSSTKIHNFKATQSWKPKTEAALAAYNKWWLSLGGISAPSLSIGLKPSTLSLERRFKWGSKDTQKHATQLILHKRQPKASRATPE